MNKKLKRLTLAIPLLTGLVLTACQEEMVSPGGGTTGGGTERTLTLLLGGNNSTTRAQGDYVPDGVTLDEEKEVRSLALFVKTQASGTDDDFHPGAFARFLSESSKPEEQLSEPLTQAGTDADGLYTCQAKVHSYSWDNPEVIAIANYHENGLATKLTDVNTWEDLLALTTQTATVPTDNPSRPLLMFGKASIKDWVNAPNGLATENIVLTRLVARIDVINNAYNNDTPTDGFVLETLQIKNARQYSLLAPSADAELMNTIPQSDLKALNQDTVKTLQRTPPTGKWYQQAICLYTHETLNDNADESLNTFMELSGKYKGSNMVIKVPFIRTLADGATETVPLMRNHRYVVTISNALGAEEVEATISALDWGEAADSVGFDPEASVPELKDMVISSSGASLDVDKKTIDITHATAATTLTLKAITRNVVSDAYIGFKHDEGFDWNGSTVGGLSAFTITPKEATLGKDNAGIEEVYTREYTVTIPQRTAQTDAATPALEAYLCIYNTALGESVADTIRIKADHLNAPVIP